jgi:transposase InsO family protein
MSLEDDSYGHYLNQPHDRRMNTIMSIDNLKTVLEMESFLSGSQAIAFGVASTKDERYAFIEKIIKRFSYGRLKRSEKGTVIRFLMKVSGYSRQQLTRMIEQYNEKGYLKRQQKTLNGFTKRYTAEDISLLAKIDRLHETPNGLRVKKLCERAFYIFGQTEYERLAGISVSHLYNLRQSSGYQNLRRHYEKTKGDKGAKIGIRRKPIPNGQPGYIRIDTVHQGDLDGIKGVYHINAVDEVTQFEIVVSVERISEAYLIPALTLLLEAFPFTVLSFHSDNGGEYINYQVARLLNKLHIEMTKSRPRHSNDNALAEGKNAAVIRKIFGYAHIPQHHANRINEFNIKALNPYINFHRPCLFSTTIIDAKGKQQKRYYYPDTMTPYEKFKSLPDALQYLKKDMTFKKLDDIANQMNDNEAAEYLQQQRNLLFKYIHEDGEKSA